MRKINESINSQEDRNLKKENLKEREGILTDLDDKKDDEKKAS